MGHPQDTAKEHPLGLPCGYPRDGHISHVGCPSDICAICHGRPRDGPHGVGSLTDASRHLPPGHLPPVICLPDFCLPSLTCLPNTCLPSITTRPSFFTTNKTGFRLCLVLRKSSQAGLIPYLAVLIRGAGVRFLQYS